jgi:glycosyltransferase involved in cell wall biosynthesis
VSAGVDCTVLVPVLNEERHLEAMLATMRAQQFDGQLQFVLADGGSTDRTLEIMRRAAVNDPRIEIHHNPKMHVASGLNVALKAACGTWVARMDAHAFYPPRYIAEGVSRLQAGGTRWVSGPQRPVGDNAVSRAVAAALRSPLGRGGSHKWHRDGEERSEFELDTGIFGGVWRRDTLLEFDGWDERWNKNEDSELAARFLQQGERLVCLPGMTADYVPRDSLTALFRQYLEYGRFRLRTAMRHPNSLRRSHLVAPALVAGGAIAVTPGRAGARARRLGLLYVAALAAESLRVRQSTEKLAEAFLVPAALVAMHAGHGLGLLGGMAEHGVPWAAIVRSYGLAATSQDHATPDATNPLSFEGTGA